MNEPSGLTSQILRQFLHKCVQVFQVLVKGVMHLRAQLRKQLKRKGVLVVQSVDDCHALLDLLVAQVEALHHGADDGDAVGHEHATEQHYKEAKDPFGRVEGKDVSVTDDGGPEEGTQVQLKTILVFVVVLLQPSVHTIIFDEGGLEYEHAGDQVSDEKDH